MQAPWTARGKLWYLISHLPPQWEQDHSLNMQKASCNSELISNIFFRENAVFLILPVMTAFHITLLFNISFSCSSSSLSFSAFFSDSSPSPSLLNTSFFGRIQWDILKNKNRFVKGKEKYFVLTELFSLTSRLNRLVDFSQRRMSGGIGVLGLVSRPK